MHVVCKRAIWLFVILMFWCTPLIQSSKKDPGSQNSDEINVEVLIAQAETDRNKAFELVQKIELAIKNGEKTINAMKAAEQSLPTIQSPNLNKFARLLSPTEEGYFYTLFNNQFSLMDTVIKRQQYLVPIQKIIDSITQSVQLVQELAQAARGPALKEKEVQLEKIEEILREVRNAKSRMERSKQQIEGLAKLAPPIGINAANKLPQLIRQITLPPHQRKELGQSKAVAAHIAGSLVNIEKDLQKLTQADLFEQALKAADFAREVLDNILPIDANMTQMTLRQQQAAAQADEVAKMVPPPPEEVPRDREEPRTRVQPAPRPPMGPPGKASSNIRKAINSLRGALRKIESIRSYLKDIPTQKATVKKKVENVLKEYEAGIKGFAAKINKIKGTSGLDQAMLEPLSTFAELVTKLYNQVKKM